MNKQNMITSAILRELSGSGIAIHAKLIAQGNGFTLLVCFGTSEKVLQAKRKHTRIFKNLDRAAAFVLSLGISKLEVEMAGWIPPTRNSADPED